MLDLAQTIVRLCNSSSRVVQVALPSDDPRHRRPDIARARALLDWSPTTPLEQGLRRTIEYFDALLTARGRRAVAQGSA
jgi:UDP-glucuronate decarboxylase